MTLKELRRQSKKTAAEVAAALGIGRSTYSNYEQGIRKLPLDLVIPLANLFDVSAEEIINAQLNLISICSTN